MSQALAATIAAEATTPPPSTTSPPSVAGQATSSSKQPITLILPTSGKLFFEKKSDLQLCKPQLLPLKSFSLEKLEKMHQEAQRQLQETRARTAAANAKEVF